MHQFLAWLGRKPRTFDWIIEPSLGACAYPREAGDWDALRAHEVSLLVNLHERAHDRSALERYGLEELHLPVRDFTPPTPAQLDSGVERIRQAIDRGQRVVVHCGAGLGRTGTLVACYLVSQGQSPDAAIHAVRAARPGSIETRAQVEAVLQYALRHSS